MEIKDVKENMSDILDQTEGLSIEEDKEPNILVMTYDLRVNF
jgi:hypothetical protein